MTYYVEFDLPFNYLLKKNSDMRHFRMRNGTVKRRKFPVDTT